MVRIIVVQDTFMKSPKSVKTLERLGLPKINIWNILELLGTPKGKNCETQKSENIYDGSSHVGFRLQDVSSH